MPFLMASFFFLSPPPFLLPFHLLFCVSQCSTYTYTVGLGGEEEGSMGGSKRKGGWGPSCSLLDSRFPSSPIDGKIYSISNTHVCDKAMLLAHLQCCAKKPLALNKYLLCSTCLNGGPDITVACCRKVPTCMYQFLVSFSCLLLHM